MSREDLPEPIRRELDHQRRSVAREVGRMYEQLLDAHVDPTAWLESIRARFAEAMTKASDGAR